MPRKIRAAQPAHYQTLWHGDDQEPSLPRALRKTFTRIEDARALHVWLQDHAIATVREKASEEIAIIPLEERRHITRPGWTDTGEHVGAFDGEFHCEHTIPGLLEDTLTKVMVVADVVVDIRPQPAGNAKILNRAQYIIAELRADTTKQPNAVYYMHAEIEENELITSVVLNTDREQGRDNNDPLPINRRAHTCLTWLARTILSISRTDVPGPDYGDADDEPAPHAGEPRTGGDSPAAAKPEAGAGATGGTTPDRDKPNGRPLAKPRAGLKIGSKYRYH